MAEIRSVFAVPMVFHRLDECESLNQELEALFHQYADNPQAYANPNPIVERNGALFESRFQLFDWPQEPVKKLRRFCLSTLYGTIGELCGYDDATLSRLHMAAESWFHLTQRGGYFGVHNHALHSWSGVYCVRHDGDDPNSASGRLSFINPNAAASMYMDMAIMNLKPPFGFGPVNLRLQPGQLVIFPSWLLHQVLPYEGDSTRITVAFNARFQLAEATGR